MTFIQFEHSTPANVSASSEMVNYIFYRIQIGISDSPRTRMCPWSDVQPNAIGERMVNGSRRYDAGTEDTFEI